MRRYEAVDALIEEYASRFTKVLQRICTCKREYERNIDIVKLLSVSDEVARCVRERRPCNLGFVEVRVIRKFLTQHVVIVVNGRELSVDDFNTLISRARLFNEWYSNDCSIDAYMYPIIGADHYDAIKEFLRRNLRELEKVCGGERPSLDFDDLPTYVVGGIKNAVNSYLLAGATKS
ncbi:MAG: hypothetical protein L7G96_04385 [Vulcanisaeta sp.]|nr:hypothetical protein [Vulcanisaeta sp.]